jgi:hypothetical protein
MNKNPTKYQVESSPAIKSSTASYDENYILSNNGILNIYGNCSKKEIEKSLQEKTKWGITLIQFARQFKVEKELLKLLNERVLKEFPNCSLRQVFNGYGAFDNLNFLEHLNNLSDLRIEMFGEIDLKPINKYCKLKSLAIGGDKSKIEGITNHESIENLFVFDKVKDIQLIGRMKNLKKLTISKMTLKNLDFLNGLTNLNELHFMLGGTKNLGALPQIGKIEELSFTWVRQLKMEHLNPINDMKFLKKLKFDRQPHLLNLDWLNNKEIETEIINCKNYKKEASR